MYTSRFFLFWCTLALAFFNEHEANSQRFAKVTPETSLHVLFSAAITIGACQIAEVYKPDMSLGQKYLIGGGIGLAAGIGKELYDEATGKYIDYTDICFDLLGVGAGLFLQYQIWDRKRIRGRVSLNMSGEACTACLRINF